MSVREGWGGGELLRERGAENDREGEGERGEERAQVYLSLIPGTWY